MYYTLITGASRGIGEALARQFASKNHALILVARSQATLEALAQELQVAYAVNVQTIALDLLEEGAPLRLLTICQQNGWQVSVLINNAGFGLWGNHADTALTEQLEIIQLNAMTVVELSHRFIPLLEKAPAAHIINIGSISSFQPVPYFSIYAATKSFVLSFSRSLRAELQTKGINVTCVCPGFTESYFFDNAGANTVPVISSAWAQMKASAIAKATFRAIQKKQATTVPGGIFKLCTLLSRYLPVSLTVFVLKKWLKPAPKIEMTSTFTKANAYR